MARAKVKASTVFKAITNLALPTDEVNLKISRKTAHVVAVAEKVIGKVIKNVQSIKASPNLHPAKVADR